MRQRILSLTAATLMCATAAQAQTSEYFLMAGDQSTFHVLQGGVLVRSWAVPGGTDQYQYPIAVGDTIRTMGASAGEVGAEYDYAGNLLGPTYVHPVGTERSWDGTRDGTSNYAIATDGAVHRYNRAWQNPVPLFDAGGTGSLTYDPTNNSLWVGQFGDDRIVNYTFDGIELSSFSTGHDRNMALALDPADGTLWLHDRTTPGTFEQWTRAGVRLQRIAVAGMATQNALGGEMALLDECVCPEDLDRDGRVAFSDILRILGAWGSCFDCAMPGVCGEFPPCAGDECICVTGFDGSGLCIDGATTCGDPCSGGTCPPGFVCLVNSCCGPTTCIPVGAQCPTDGLAAPPPGTAVIGGVMGPDGRVVSNTAGICFNRQCLEDIDLDGRVAFSDIVRVLGAWGPCE